MIDMGSLANTIDKMGGQGFGTCPFCGGDLVYEDDMNNEMEGENYMLGWILTCCCCGSEIEAWQPSVERKRKIEYWRLHGYGEEDNGAAQRG